MNGIDILLIGMLLAVFALAGFGIYKSKKSGKKCVGCPYGGQCAHCKTQDKQ